MLSEHVRAIRTAPVPRLSRVLNAFPPSLRLLSSPPRPPTRASTVATVEHPAHPHRKHIIMRTSSSYHDSSDHEQRRLRLAQRDRLQREHDWQRLLQLRPFL
ncbi:hypothetical protein GCM10009806_21140 [Microbacterium flavum]